MPLETGDLFERVAVTPAEVLAGDTVEFVVAFTIGKNYPAHATRLVLSCPGMLGFSRVAVHNWEDDGLSTVQVSNPAVDCVARAWNSEIAEFPSEPPSERFRKKGTWGQRFTVIDLGPGLQPGDTVAWHWGDTRRGHGKGCRVTGISPRPGFQVTVDVSWYRDQKRGIPDFDRDYLDLPRPIPDARFSLPIAILPREAARVRVLRTAQRALALPLDRFWNVASDGTSRLFETDTAGTRNDWGGFEYPPHVKVRPRSLPLIDAPPCDDVFEGLNIYWGDLHTHSTYSVDCLEREKMPMTPDDLMQFARLRAGLDFYGLTDHHITWCEEHYWIGEDRWADTMESVRRRHEEGAFVVIPGIEFGDGRCDTNLHFNGTPCYSLIARPWKDVREIWEALEGEDYLSIPHFHRGGWLDEGEWWECPDFSTEPVIEVYSTHGVFDRPAPPPNYVLLRNIKSDRNMVWMHRQGYRYGVIGGSDGHKGHVGQSALTGLYAAELTRDAVFDAHRKRRTYATTNARIRLLFTANGVLMGGETKNTREKHFHIDATGESPLAFVELLRNGEPQRRIPVDGVRFEGHLSVREDEPGWWQARVRQRDAHLAVSSPVWFD